MKQCKWDVFDYSNLRLYATITVQIMYSAGASSFSTVQFYLLSIGTTLHTHVYAVTRSLRCVANAQHERELHWVNKVRAVCGWRFDRSKISIPSFVTNSMRMSFSRVLIESKHSKPKWEQSLTNWYNLFNSPLLVFNSCVISPGIIDIWRRGKKQQTATNGYFMMFCFEHFIFGLELKCVINSKISTCLANSAKQLW